VTSETVNPPLLASENALVGRRALVIGAGGLGCAVLSALADSGVTFVIADDDTVDATNLHRQILFGPEAIGRDKLDAARDALVARGVAALRIELVRSRFLPDNARSLAASVDLVLEGADNYATKFLAADACRLESRPIVHGAAVRFVATVLYIGADGRPCYRCLFEDLPVSGAQQNCAEAGVLGPVVGIAGALMADAALRALTETDARPGRLVTYDARDDRLRELAIEQNPGCALCGRAASIVHIEETRYTTPSCAA
jgi:molybdopterin/thiamine biosynthesis adenylyltransferase